jgi:hypothetical protein
VGIEEEYKICSNEILSEYQIIKNEFDNETTIICQHIGTFSQDILISVVSLVEHALIQNGELKSLRKRLTYLVIETIQNIMFHSDKLPDTNQLAYILVTKNSWGYTISSSNSLETKNIKSLVKKLDEFLSVKTAVLSKLFTKKIQSPGFDSNGFGGLGLLTMVHKSGKGFRYEISKVSKTYSLFHIELKLYYKSYK